MISRDQLKLWVHRENHLAAIAEFTRQRGEPALPSMPIAAGLSMFLAGESPLGVFPLTQADLLPLGLGPRDAIKRAMQNAQKALTRKATTDGAGLFTWEMDHAGILTVLGARVAAKLGLRGAPAVMLPAPDVALLAGRDDARALEAMLETAQAAYEGAADPCSLRALTWDGPEPREWAPPVGHPLRAKFLAAARASHGDDLRDTHRAFERGEGPYSEATLARGGGRVAEWRPGPSVVVSQVDRVLLRASADEALEVDFAALCEVVPHAVERLEWPVPAPFFRLRGKSFPSQRQRAFLARRSPGSALREVPGDDLLAAWDAGVPVLAEADVEGGLRLLHPDRRTALVTRAQFGVRAATLAAIDEVALRASLATVAAFPLRG